MSAHDRRQAGIDYYARQNRAQMVATWRGPVESLLVAILFFGLLVVALDYGRVMMVQQAVDNAAYEAARTTVVPGAERQEATATAEQLVATAGVPNAKIEVQPDEISDAHGLVRVRISVAYRDVTWFLKYLQRDDKTIDGTATVLTERFAATQYLAVTTLANEHATNLDTPVVRTDDPDEI